MALKYPVIYQIGPRRHRDDEGEEGRGDMPDKVDYNVDGYH